METRKAEEPILYSTAARVSLLSNHDDENDDDHNSNSEDEQQHDDGFHPPNNEQDTTMTTVAMTASTAAKRINTDGDGDGDSDLDEVYKKIKSQREEEIRVLVQDELSSTDKNRVAEVLSKLASLCKENDPNAREHRKMLGKFESGLIVLRFVMKHNPDIAKIQSQGCRFLMNWMRDNDSGKEAVCRLGGIATIIMAMRAFPNDSFLQRRAIGALWNISSPFKRERVQQIVEGGAIPAVITAMKAHPDDVVLQQRSCKMLADLCKVKEYRPLVLEAGGFGVAAIAIERHFAVDDILNRCATKVVESLLKLMKK